MTVGTSLPFWGFCIITVKCFFCFYSVRYFTLCFLCRISLTRSPGKWCRSTSRPRQPLLSAWNETVSYNNCCVLKQNDHVYFHRFIYVILLCIWITWIYIIGAKCTLRTSKYVIFLYWFLIRKINHEGWSSSVIMCVDCQFYCDIYKRWFSTCSYKWLAMLFMHELVTFLWIREADVPEGRIGVRGWVEVLVTTRVL